jgi:molybdate transport system substrate-binding protein
LLPGLALAGQVTVAVAANFLTTAREIAEVFEADGGDNVVLVPGSSGKLYAQIIAGAPFDVFLSADVARPERLQRDGLDAPGGRLTYALGRLALVHRNPLKYKSLDDLLTQDLRLAIADPKIAPYGVAAADLLQSVRGADWRRGVVYGESVGQAFAFVATGNVDAGLVGLAQVRAFDGRLTVLPVPADRHAPIRQDAVLLARAADNPAARRFFDSLTTPGMREIIVNAGYEVTP